MSGLSNIIKNGATLAALAGPQAIAANDLLELAGSPAQLYPARITDYAAVNTGGATCVGATSVPLFSGSSQRKEVYQSADASIFVIGSYLASSAGVRIYKYSLSGVLSGTLTLDSVAGSVVSNAQVFGLSNGNLCATWALDTNVLKFAIFDANLNQIMATTNVATPLATLQHNAIPLAGGGVAIAYPMAAGVFLAIYSNTGAVVSAGAVMAGTSSTNASVKLAQLSNGNIVAVVTSTAAAKAMGHAIYSVTGALVLAFTALDAITSSNANLYPEISTLAGFYCCSFADGVNQVAYVLSNAGVLQGAGYSAASATNSSSSYTTLQNDGTAFWLVYWTGSLTVVLLPVSGVGYVSTATGAGAAPFSSFIERGTLVVSYASQIAAFQLSASGSLPFRTGFATVLPGSLVTMGAAMPGGDSTAIVVGSTSFSLYFGVQKYATTNIFGIAQAAVAAGNAGTVVTVNAGPGSYPTNAMLGTIGKTFSGIGPRGIMFGYSVTLSASRNIN